LLQRPATERPSATERQAALAAQLLRRYGIVTRQTVAAEGVRGGFAGLYPVLKAMEEAGRARRGYFVQGLGGAQFASPGAEDRLREAQQQAEDSPQYQVLAATDPANPYGNAVGWPASSAASGRPARSAGARVLLQDGRLIGYLSRTGQHLLTFPPAEPTELAASRVALADALARYAVSERAVFLNKVDNQPVAESPLAAALLTAGFSAGHRGFSRRARPDIDHA
jgi:ATP-dependent Lhr-like helicase